MIIKEKITKEERLKRLRERWGKFSQDEQIMHIKAELMRAKIFQEKDKKEFLSAIERAINLIDLSLEDNRWQGWRSMLFGFRDEICKLYLGISKNSIDFIFSGL